MFACGSPATPDAVESAKKLPLDYGPLQVDPNGLLNLPNGFEYKIISTVGDPMEDDLLLPGAPDGMAAFEVDGGKIAVVRNHELSSMQVSVGPFGAQNEKLKGYTADQMYEHGKGVAPGLGGTSTFIFNEETMEIEKTWMSLAGTVRNCSGGAMPWGSWVTCEEDVSKAGDFDGNYEKDHGYAFEVPVTTEAKLHAPVPLKAMGRMNHEACVCDPNTGIIYLTEDRPDGCIYRFIPNVKGRLAEGGKLQALAIKGMPTCYTRNWTDQTNNPIEMGKQYQTEWIDLDNVEAPEDDLRFRAQEAGAAVFARGEGIWFGDNEFYVACTNGGLNLKGQIFRYIPGAAEANGKDGHIELFVEPNDENIMKYCDNLTVAPWGDVMICEDDTHAFLRGVTPEGEIFTFGKTVNPIGEFTGICFSPSGKTMFVNIQHEGLTLAISGPWKG